MITSTLLQTLLLSTPSEIPHALSILKAEGYEVTSERMAAYKIESRADFLPMSFRGPDGSSLRLTVHWTSRPGQRKHVEGQVDSPDFERQVKLQAAGSVKEMGMPSKLPPSYARIYRENLVNLAVNSTWATVICVWRPPIKSTHTGFIEREPFDFNEKAVFVERVVRRTLANAIGTRLQQSVDQSELSAVCRLTGAKFGNLSQWAVANGWTTGEEDKYGIVTFKKGANETILPLGADQIKVNGVWKEMGDSAAFFNGKLYLPATGLEHLRKA
jgi:hypothetical protein